ncbi:hypothetical protein NEM30_27350, partial [Escherichia coli]|nr:hypothetical protein [Escherichia coli]
SATRLNQLSINHKGRSAAFFMLKKIAALQQPFTLRGCDNVRNKKPVTGSSYTEPAGEDRQYHPCFSKTYI